MDRDALRRQGMQRARQLIERAQLRPGLVEALQRNEAARGANPQRDLRRPRPLVGRQRHVALQVLLRRCQRLVGALQLQHERLADSRCQASQKIACGGGLLIER